MTASGIGRSTQPGSAPRERLSDDTLSVLVAAGRRHMLTGRTRLDPAPGEMVVEVSSFRRTPDPDAIGVLVGHDQAPYNEDDPLDGSVPMREVWDVRPLSGRQQKDWGYQRWENAEFVALPDIFRSLLSPAEAPDSGAVAHNPKQASS